MNEKLFLEIASGIVTILVAVITSFVIPYIKSKIDSDKLEKLDYFIKIAVRCAEQIYTPEQWKEKKDYVVNYITDLINNSLHIKLTASEIDDLIEGAVYQLKHENTGVAPYVASAPAIGPDTDNSSKQGLYTNAEGSLDVVDDEVADDDVNIQTLQELSGNQESEEIEE